MGDVHVAADDDRLLRVQPLEVHAEVLLPAQAVLQAGQLALAVGRVDRHQEEFVVLQRD